MKKISISLKDPDGVYEAVKEFVEQELENMDLDEDEKDFIREERHEKYMQKLEKWIEFGEHVRVEFDIESMVAVVLQNK